MKKLSYLFLSVALTAMAVGCNNNTPETPPTPTEDPENRSLQIEVTVENATKALMSDGGFVWKDADATKLGVAVPGKVYASKSITADGAKASFNVEVPYKTMDLYLFYPYAADQLYTEASFTLPASILGATAGELSGDGVILAGKSIVRLAAETDTVADNVSAAMAPVSAILKVLVYSSNADYQSEKVQAVTLNANADINGTITYDLTKNALTVKGAGSKVSSVMLATPLALTGADTKESAAVKGIYMSLLPTTTVGYKYTVETDVATYTFESENARTFEAATITTEGLDLSNASSRIDGTTPVVTYNLSNLNTEIKVSADGETVDAGYFVASLNGEPKEDFTAEYYAGVACEGGANWVNATIEDNRLKLVVNPNNATESRTCTLKLVYTPKEYVIASRNIAEINITQACPTLDLTYVGAIDNKSVDSGASTAPLGLGYWYATVNGVTKEHSTNPEFYDNCTFTVTDEEGNPVTWLTCVYRANDTWWDVTYEANTSETPRKAYIKGTFADVEGYNITNPVKDGVVVTQKGKSTTGVPEITYEGNLEDQYTFGGEARLWYDLGWWYAMVSAGGVTTKHETFPADAFYYSTDNITVTITDDSEEHNPVEWIRLRLPENSCHWNIQYDANETDATRTAIITATYNIPGHTCTNPVKAIRFTQRSLNAAKELTYEGGLAESYSIPYTANEKYPLSWYYAKVDGLVKEHASTANNMYYDNCTFTITDQPNKEGNTVDWCTCKYRDYDTWWDIAVTENPYNVARTCYITADYAEIEGHIITNPTKTTTIIQAANPNGVDPE